MFDLFRGKVGLLGRVGRVLRRLVCFYLFRKKAGLLGQDAF